MTPAGQLHLGWQYAMPVRDPGPPPRRPVPEQRPELSPDWLAAQRREENLIGRPLKVTAAVAATIVVVAAACVAAGWLPALIAAPVFTACLVAAGLSGYGLWQGERALRDRIDAERSRVERFRADRESRLFAHQAEHALRVTAWQRERAAFERQKRWYAVGVPDEIDRVDVAGGTLSGWSALLTMSGAHLLAEGGEVTVIDLSGGAVATDLVRLATLAGDIAPAVWVLPRDLPRLDLTASLGPGELADVLALSAGAAEERSSARELAIDAAILDRVLGALGAGSAIRVDTVAAALRALAQVGDPVADIEAGLLTEPQASAVGALFGQGAADRVVLERALGIEAQLRALAEAGADPARPPRSRLRVIAVDGSAGPLRAGPIGCFVVTALGHQIGRAPAVGGNASWHHTIFLLGAERLRGDILDRLTDGCERARHGLVLGYRSMPAPVRQRIGRGNAAVAFMRLGNAEDARAASEQLGSEHRFVISQLTETIGKSVTGTVGASYTSTVGGSASAGVSASSTESSSRGSGRSHATDRGFARPGGGGSASDQEGTSAGTSESASLTAGISASTAWGVSTSRAAGDSASLARSLQRSRELVVEPAELQRLPATALILSYAAPAGRRVLLADVNPAIGALPVATMTPLAATPRNAPAETGLPGPGPDSGAAMTAGPDDAAQAAPLDRPNLGPPPPRLDWRGHRRRPGQADRPGGPEFTGPS